jgi:hypothetical protein
MKECQMCDAPAPVVTLSHTHGRQDGTRGIGPHQQIDLVGGDQLLIQGASQIRLGLVVLADPLNLAAEQTPAGIELLDVDIPHQLVGQAGGRQGAGQGQGAADANGRSLGVHGGGHGPCCTGCSGSQYRTAINLLHAGLL